MRKTAMAVVTVATAALLAGCGGSDKSDDKDAAKGTSASQAAKAEPKEGAGKGASHQVTLEVRGKGTTQVYYYLDTNGGQTVTLPWKKTATITPEGAERKVGRLVTITPGSSQGEDGMLRAASCSIIVDGKKVADNQDGKSGKPCEYELK
ncbi:hypothetical protein [Streptomyces huiliensis]|uniref:hypothetical protein n=1 Tax=Streptomyces huiliensis TaxID=2876027 RepID=UPI001CBEED66|nr:hypothetical protein [Streptomyces huiliensis]MBZ4321595.1 hypothetical protein [Streptomyces huiliensis]